MVREIADMIETILIDQCLINWTWLQSLIAPALPSNELQSLFDPLTVCLFPLSYGTLLVRGLIIGIQYT